MSDMHFEKSNKKSFFEKQGFYIALAICLLAVGASSWAAVNKLRSNDNLTANVSSAVTSLAPESVTADVNNPVSDVPYVVSSREPVSQAEASSEQPSSSEQAVSSQSSEAPFFVMPSGGSITKNFDNKNLQYSETYKDWRLHLGIDIAAEQGTPVMSAADGTVKEIYQDQAYGCVVLIDHGGDLTGYYSGLNEQPSVQPGDQVEAGDQIGTIDVIPCESVEQTHLHFAMKKGETFVSPLEYMGMLDQE